MGIVEQKRCNALIRNAEPDFSRIRSSAAQASVAFFQQRFGGLWVGGTATLSDEALAFRPNAENQRLHKNDCSWWIALETIRAADLRFGFVTKIVDVKTAATTQSLRCFGAAAFAGRIASRARASQADTSRRSDPDAS